MKRYNKITIGLLILLFCVFALYQLARMFSPGSYPFAEVYEINAPEKDVIKAIEEFKNMNPEFIVPNVTIEKSGVFSLSESEGRKEKSHWYFNYFYYKKENKIILTWTRPAIENNKTDFAFVSINEGLDLGNWKDVNDDFGYFENKDVKAKFENLILIPIKRLLVNKE